ncbi:MAG: leucine-rich repeat domain-containing protein [Promethearchaeota archaeon]
MSCQTHPHLNFEEEKVLNILKIKIGFDCSEFYPFENSINDKFIGFRENDKKMWYNCTRFTGYYFPNIQSRINKSSSQENLEYRILGLNFKDRRDLHRFPKEISVFKNLKSLHIRNCPIEDIKVVAQLSQLRELVLDNVALTSLPSILINLKNLERIAIINTPLERFPIFLSQMPQIKRVILKNLQLPAHPSLSILPKLDPSIWNINSLEELVLIGWSTPEISPKIGNWIDLERFHFEGICQKPLPDSIKKCRKLNELLLQGVKTPLPESLGDLSSLFSLHLANELIQGIPASISKLKKIGILNFYTIGKFVLNHWPIQMQTILNLLYFRFEGLCNEPLPVWFGNFQRLNQMILNGIKEPLPNIFEKLKNLSVLEIRNSQISELSPSFCHNTRLEFLSLINCQLKKLPHNIGDLSSLIEMYLNNNPINKIPISILNCCNLQRLNLRGK